MKRPVTFYILLITIVTLSLSCGLSNPQSDVEIQFQVDATINAIHRETASSNVDLPVILTFTRVPVTEESPNPFQPEPTDPPILPTTPSPDSEAPSVNTNDNSVYYPLRDCAPSRVYLGYIVSPENGVDYISIRNEPDTHPSDNKIGKIYPGEQAKIVGGPICNYGWILWKIKKLSDGVIGWIPESDGEEFWLKSESSESSDLPDSPSSTPKPIACPSTLPTRLRIGMDAQVTTSGLVPKLGIRHKPGKENKKFDELQSGETFEIISGPECSDNSYWWYVYTDSGLEGWLRESNDEFYFIDPVQ